MKQLFFPLLLVILFQTLSWAEAKPITSENCIRILEEAGGSGFFLTREDMEVAVNDMEAHELLKRDYSALQGFYQEQLTLNQNLWIENNKFMKKISFLKNLSWVLGLLATGGTLYGLLK